MRDSFSAGQIGALAFEYATTENTRCWAAWSRALGSENIDLRLRQTDPAFDAALTGAPWLGTSPNSTTWTAPGGRSFLRKDHPLMAQRLRQAAKRGTQILMVDSARRRSPDAGRRPPPPWPRRSCRALAEVAVAWQAKQAAVPAEFASVTPGENAKIIAAAWHRVPTPPC